MSDWISSLSMSAWLDDEKFECYKEALNLEQPCITIREAIEETQKYGPDTELERMVYIKTMDMAISNTDALSMADVLNYEKIENNYEFMELDSDKYIDMQCIEDLAYDYGCKFEDLDETAKEAYSNADSVDGNLLELAQEYCSDKNEAIYVAGCLENDTLFRNQVMDYFRSSTFNTSYIELSDDCYSPVNSISQEFDETDIDSVRDEILEGMTLAERVELLVNNPELREEQDDHFEDVTDAMMEKLAFAHTLEGQDRKAYIQALVSDDEIEAVALPDLTFELPANLSPAFASSNYSYESALTGAKEKAMAQKEQDRDR